jgi:diguanylate cyclase (GGDEF)-like protein
MSLFRTSIRARLTIFAGAFALIVVGLAAISAIGSIASDRHAQELDRRWLAGTQILGELGEQIAEFRIAEEYRAIAPDMATRARAETLAIEHRAAVAELVQQYGALLDDRTGAALDSFRHAWNAYLAQHEDWVKKDIDGNIDGPAHYDSESHRLYKLAGSALDNLVTNNLAIAHGRAARASQIAHLSMIIGTAVSALVIAFTLWLIFQVRNGLIQPLEAITFALTSLSHGDRDVRVPALDRDDELGELAQAFELFRANALALEIGHQATKKAQEEALSQARHDSLTGLPNRRVFAADLEAALGRTRNGGTNYAVLLIDLDHFKPVNDLLGHTAGDLVLCEIAARLRSVVRKSDTAVRLGGDEFAIIAEGEPDPKANMENAIRLANRVLDAIRQPIHLGSGAVEVGASIGIALCHSDNTNAESLQHEADIAMYRAKRDGRGVYRFFERSMDIELREQAALQSDLKLAILTGEIRPFYQPLVDIRQNKICAFEALARWTHPVRGCVSPDIFIPLAEQLGLIPDLTLLILRQACRDARAWTEDIRLSVNISPTQLKDPRLGDWILQVIAEEGFSPKRLEIEITENAVVSDLQIAKAILTKLQSVGVTVALDDFGTGYSTLYHLWALKFDKVKIDRSFIHAMMDSPESEKIVDAILSLARNLKLPTVAEGVENPAVLRHLAKNGCDFGQGFYFGKAMNAGDASGVLEMAAVA